MLSTSNLHVLGKGAKSRVHHEYRKNSAIWRTLFSPRISPRQSSSSTAMLQLKNTVCKKKLDVKRNSEKFRG